MIGLVIDRRRWWPVAAAALGAALLTQLVYPLMYGLLLAADPLAAAVLTARNLVMIALLVWAIVRLARVPQRARHPVVDRSPTESEVPMLIAFSVAPSGTGTADGSVHDAVAAAVRVVRESGLPHRTTSMFTELEGEWDEVFDVVKRATEAVLPFGSRVSLVLKADIRPGYSGEIDGKVERLEQALERPRDSGFEAV